MLTDNEEAARDLLKEHYIERDGGIRGLMTDIGLLRKETDCSFGSAFLTLLERIETMK